MRRFSARSPLVHVDFLQAPAFLPIPKNMPVGGLNTTLLLGLEECVDVDVRDSQNLSVCVLHMLQQEHKECVPRLREQKLFWRHNL